MNEGRTLCSRLALLVRRSQAVLVLSAVATVSGGPVWAAAQIWEAAVEYCVTPMEEDGDADTSGLVPIEGEAAQMIASMLGSETIGQNARAFIVPGGNVLLRAALPPERDICMFVSTGGADSASDAAKHWAAREIASGRYRNIGDGPLWNVLGIESTGWRNPRIRVTVHSRDSDGFFGVQVTEIREGR